MTLELIHFIDMGKYKEIIRDDKLLFKCPYCREEKWFAGLAYHTNQYHGITAKELRNQLGVKSNYQLITPALKLRHRQIVMENKESHITRNLIKKGKSTRYDKGSKGHVKENWSVQAIEERRIRGFKQFKNLNKKKRDDSE